MHKAHHHHSLSATLVFKLLTRNLFIGSIIIGLSLFLGMFGYYYFESMTWTDAYVNAAMILSGMGPVSELHTTYGKLFAGTYALFSGVIFLVVIAIILAPAFQHFFHKLHLIHIDLKK